MTDAARWIGVVEMAIRRWPRGGHLMPPTRDRVIAATLRKAAAKALGLTVEEWWDHEQLHSGRLVEVLEQHNDVIVELLRDLLQKSEQPLEA